MEYGDVSRIPCLSSAWRLPDEELFPDDYVKKNPLRDLSRPGTLSTNSATVSQPSTKPYTSLPKFDVHQIMLFKDPDSGKDAYGRIVSQWDVRTASQAPAIIRTDGSPVCYIVERLGLIDSVANLDELCRLAEVRPKEEDAFAIFEGVEDVENRHAYSDAKAIDRRIANLRRYWVIV